MAGCRHAQLSIIFQGAEASDAEIKVPSADVLLLDLFLAMLSQPTRSTCRDRVPRM